LLRNTSDTAVFAPLDEAFVREPDRRLPDTFIESINGDRHYAYRLPVAGEWAIVGQSFATLRPGEPRRTLIVTDPKTAGQVSGPLTWRVRLRTAPESTAVVGIMFHADDIKAEHESNDH